MKAIITSEKGGLGASSPVLMTDRESIMLPTSCPARVVFLVTGIHSVLRKYVDTECSNTVMLQGTSSAINRPNPNPDGLSPG